jgi:diguanylate cyclase (GGDEF)-like protein/PAS domain S-box-containing protein
VDASLARSAESRLGHALVGHALAALSGAQGKCTEQALQESEERYRCLVDLSRDAILVHSEGECVLVNEAAVDLFRASGAEQLLGKPILDLVHTKDRDVIDEPIRNSAAQGRRARRIKRKLIRLDQSVIDAEVATCSCRHNGKPAVQLIVRDLAESLRLASRLSYLAQYDLLTELPNRSQMRERLCGAMARASRNRQLIGLLFLDLDHFNVINQTWGHAVGDFTLQQVAERLKRCTRKSDTVARLGGDEFCLILEGLAEKRGAAVTAQRVLEALSQPIRIDDHEIPTTFSIGITVYPTDADTLDRLLRNADVAMYYAKDCGRNNYQFYSPELDARSHRDELRRAEIEQRLKLLTPREREVLHLLVTGKANKIIAHLLGTSPRTIENHRARIMDKMEAESLPELVRMMVDPYG